MARLCSLLRHHHPHAYEQLLAAGATEARLADTLADASEYRPEPGDDELTTVRSRRLTLEWVLRRTVLAHKRVRLRGGSLVAGLVAERSLTPHATGVRLADGSTINADLTVVAGGKRTRLPAWYTEIGARPMPEESGGSGVTYISRFYRLPADQDFDRNRHSIVTHGYLQGGVFEADNRTFSASAALPREDRELRKLLLEPGNFERMLRELPQYDGFSDATTDPISSVAVMAEVTNRWRDLTVDDQPLATGVIPVGDTLMCTNPTYGRGMSTTAWSVEMLATALDRHANDPTALVAAYASAVNRELKPWYQVSCEMDEANRRNAAAVLAGRASPAQDLEFGQLSALARYDTVVQRALLRSLNLLAPPQALAADPEVHNRLEALKQRYPDAGTEQRKPPERTELITMLTTGRHSTQQTSDR